MPLLAENIMATVNTLLTTGLAGVLVDRGRVDALPNAALPAVGLYQGGDAPLEESAWPFMDSLLEVRTEVAAAAATPAALETALNELRRRVHVLMMAPNALALAYVVDIMPVGTEEPQTDGAAEKIKGSMVCRWGVHYRHKWENAGESP